MHPIVQRCDVGRTEDSSSAPWFRGSLHSRKQQSQTYFWTSDADEKGDVDVVRQLLHEIDIIVLRWIAETPREEPRGRLMRCVTSALVILPHPFLTSTVARYIRVCGQFRGNSHHQWSAVVRRVKLWSRSDSLGQWLAK